MENLYLICVVQICVVSVWLRAQRKSLVSKATLALRPHPSASCHVTPGSTGLFAEAAHNKSENNTVHQKATPKTNLQSLFSVKCKKCRAAVIRLPQLEHKQISLAAARETVSRLLLAFFSGLFLKGSLEQFSQERCCLAPEY